MNEQELNQKFSEYEQRIMQLQEQLGAIEKSVLNMTSVSTGLNDLKGKVNEEILAPIGSGIYIKAKLLSDDLLVDIGEGAFVDKTISETQDLIRAQQEKLKLTQKDLDKELEKINEEITQLMVTFQKEREEQNK